MVNDVELSGPPINESEGESDLDRRMKNMKIDATPDGSIATSEVSSSDQMLNKSEVVIQDGKRNTTCNLLSTGLLVGTNGTRMCE